MIRYLMFGRGPIARRLLLVNWYVCLEWKLQDMWVGAFWKRQGHVFDAWICLLPCLPIHVCLIYHDPEQ